MGRANRILIYLADAQQARQLGAALGEQGLTVQCVAGAQALLLALRTQPWDLVVCDVQLPDGDGFELCRQVKNVTAGRSPMVALTAQQGDPGLFLRALICGADHLLLKPFSEDALLAGIAALLGGSPGPGGEGGAILIVEDSRTQALALDGLLRRHGYRTRVASNGLEGLELARQEVPLLAISDVMMPGMDGYEFCRQLKQDERLGSVRVVLLSGQAEPADVLRGLEAKADCYFGKPSSERFLVGQLASLLAAVPTSPASSRDASQETDRLRQLLLHLYEEIRLQNRQLREAQTQLRQLNTDLEHRVAERTAELRVAQEQVNLQERLHALGQMASGIAHDLNNALSPIRAYVQMLLADDSLLEGHAEARHDLEVVATATEDAVAVVGRLQDFYRPRGTSEATYPVNVNRTVAEAVTLTSPRWKSEAKLANQNIQVCTELSEVPLVGGSPSELRQALTNLILNAVDAIPKDGSITIRTRQDGRDVAIEVADTGTGMTDEVRRHCLEPFYTTKGQRGTGMGLASVYGIVRRHNGALDIRSAPGQGTTITLRLPLSASEPLVFPRDDRPPAPAVKWRVLVIDDDPKSRQTIQEVLLAQGHAVDSVGTGAAGLSLQERLPFDLAIVDLALPDMRGDHLAGIVRDRWPATRVIVCSGFSSYLQDHAKTLSSIAVLLPKPFSANGLLQAATSAMAPRAGGAPPA